MELSIVLIRPVPPQCQARLYIIGSRLTRSHFRANVDSIDVLSLATTILVFWLSLLTQPLANSLVKATLIGHVPFPAPKHRSPSQPVRGVPLTLALQLDPVHGTSTAYRGLAWSMKDNGKSPRPQHLPSLVTFSGYVGLVGYCFWYRRRTD